jgi:cystathionine beta-lyase/cystathionine gamma-synthase
MKKADSRRMPIYRDTGFAFESIEDAKQAFLQEAKGPQSSEQYIYSRYGNPTVIETEGAVAKLEGCEWALLTASGMAAIDVGLSIFQKPNDKGPWLFFSELYGGTVQYVHEVLKNRRAIKVEWFNYQNESESFSLDSLQQKLDAVEPTLLFFEPVTNPLLIVVDGREVLSIAAKKQIRTVVDNTLATPSLWRPLDDGADIVIHSATKYLAGHGNITAGVVAGNCSDLRDSARRYRKLAGNILGPDDAYRLGTQLKTFDLRFSTQSNNAYKLATASRVWTHSAVKRIRYPGLPSPEHETHEEANKTFYEGKGYGAMITLEFRGGRPACDSFVAAIADHIPYVVTLGDAESTLLHVSTVFGEDKYPYPGMLRLSIGVEPYNQIETAILNALDQIPTFNGDQ